MHSKKSHIRLYADECFPITSALYIRSLGYSIVHAFDIKLIRKKDFLHLQTAQKLKRTLITLDRDFLYFEKANLDKHPGVIVISTGSATPKSINIVIKKLLKNISPDFTKESIIKITTSKIIIIKEDKIVFEKKL